MAFPNTRPALGQKTVKKVEQVSTITAQHVEGQRNPLVAALGSNLPTETTRTENGMKTYRSSLNAATDFFFVAAALRKGGRLNQVVEMWRKVWDEDNTLAIRLLFWLRDIRGGAGEKQAFRFVLNHLYFNQTDVFNQVVKYVPEYGSWKDLVSYIELSPEVQREFGTALRNKNGLAAKWLGRPAGKHLAQADAMRAEMGMSRKDYRHLLVELTNVVEQQMCANVWGDIKYESVPSQAMHVYRTAFFRHDATRFQQVIDSANKGEVVMKAGAIFPGDLVAKLQLKGDYDFTPRVSQQEVSAINAQWLGLPDYMGDTPTSMIVAADVSGSMSSSPYMKGSSPRDNAIALAVYVAERMKGPFANTLMTYSTTSKFYELNPKHSLSQKIATIREDNMGTDLGSVFTRLLRVAQANSIKPEDMPKQVVIISDMEFNSYKDKSALEMVNKLYKREGYPMPHLVFWNMAARHENVPARANEPGVSLISGYSPAIMKSVLQAKSMATPTELMLDTINGPRYAAITL